jgi:hypothetical protein
MSTDPTLPHVYDYGEVTDTDGRVQSSNYLNLTFDHGDKGKFEKLRLTWFYFLDTPLFSEMTDHSFPNGQTGNLHDYVYTLELAVCGGGQIRMLTESELSSFNVLNETEIENNATETSIQITLDEDLAGAYKIRLNENAADFIIFDLLELFPYTPPSAID